MIIVRAKYKPLEYLHEDSICCAMAQQQHVALLDTVMRVDAEKIYIRSPKCNNCGHVFKDRRFVKDADDHSLVELDEIDIDEEVTA